MSQDKFKAILEEMLELYVKKNNDYGNSFHTIYGTLGFKVGTQNLGARIIEKATRVVNLLNNNQQVSEEGIRDTLMDIANYAVMGVMEVDENSGRTADRAIVKGFQTHRQAEAINDDRINCGTTNTIYLKKFLGTVLPAQKGITANRNPHAVIGVGKIATIGLNEKNGVMCLYVEWCELKDVKTGKPLQTGDDMKSWYPIEELPEYGLYDIYVEYKKNSL